MAHSRRPQSGQSILQRLAFPAICLLAPCALAQEITVKNDSFVNEGPAVIVGDFAAGEHAGVRLTSPCDGVIVAVQIGWLHGDGFPPPDPSVERAIHIFDGDTFPQPGSELALLQAPLLVTGFLNEFRYLDENNQVPLNVPVTAGQRFYVTLEFDNPTNIMAGTASVFRDLDGCQNGKNTLFAIPGGWTNFCVFLVGDLVIRAVVNCEALSGACCLPDGSCEIITQSECTAAGGVYQGDLTDCDDVDCPEPTGACCFEGGGCVDNLTEAQCTGAQGFWQGPGSDCDEITCFPIGACCLLDGTCVDDVSPEECETLGGVFQGDGSVCAPELCPEPIGACCFDDGFCLPLTEGDCGQANGAWMGPGSDCSDNNGNGNADACECDPADMNCDGLVDAFDIEPFLEILFEKGAPCDDCTADVNGDGEINAFDIEPFLERLFP